MSKFVVSTVQFSATYTAPNEDYALDLYAKEAGYPTFDALLAQVPGSSRDDLKVTEIPETNESRKEDLDAAFAAADDAYWAAEQQNQGSGVANLATVFFLIAKINRDAHMVALEALEGRDPVKVVEEITTAAELIAKIAGDWRK